MDSNSSKLKKEGVATLAQKQSNSFWHDFFFEKHPNNRNWEWFVHEQARKKEDLSQKKNFVIYASSAFTNSIAICTVLSAFLGALIHISVEDKIDTAFAIFFYALAAFSLFGFFYLVSYRCTVSEEKMVKRVLWIFKKEILWSKVKYKGMKRRSAIEGISIVLYDERKKRLIDFDPAMVGYTNMELMITRKRIPSRHKKIKK